MAMVGLVDIPSARIADLHRQEQCRLANGGYGLVESSQAWQERFPAHYALARVVGESVGHR